MNSLQPALALPPSTIGEASALELLLHPQSSASFGGRPSSDGEGDGLGAQVRRRGHWLHEQGLRRGHDCIIVDGDPGQTLVTFLAALSLGARPAICSGQLGSGGPRALLAKLERLRGMFPADAVLLAPAPLATRAPASLEVLALARLDTGAPQLAPELEWIPQGRDAAYYQLSSGTTGRSKAIVVSWAALGACLDTTAALIGWRAHHRVLHWMPLNHDYGLTSTLLALREGSQVELLSPAAFLSSPLGYLERMSKQRTSFSLAPPFALSYCLRRIGPEALRSSSVDLSALEHLALGGESLAPADARAFWALLEPYGLKASAFRFGYGLGEMTCATHGSRPDAALTVTLRRAHFGLGEPVDISAAEPGLGSSASAPEQLQITAIGHPGPGIECWLEDEQGAQIGAEGICGELVMRGPTMAMGYQRGPRERETWGEQVRTGDVGFMFEGQLFLVDRINNLIIRRGRNFLAREFERPLASALGVHHGRVLVLDTDLQDPEAPVVALVEFSEVLQLEGIGERLRALDLPLALAALYVVEGREHTRTSSGKKRYAWLRHLLSEGKLDWRQHIELSSPPAPEPEPERGSEALARVLVELLGPRVPAGLELHGGLRLREDLELDSVDLVELGVELGKRLGLALPSEALAELETLAELEALVDAPAAVQTPTANSFEQRMQLLHELPHTLLEVEAQQGRALDIEGQRVADFASCNYLGLDLHEEVIASIEPAVRRWGVHPSWSRAIASPAIYGEVERALAKLVGADHALCFPTITLLHAGVLPLLVGRGALFVDNFAHQSIHDAASLCAAGGGQVHRLRHGELDALERQLAAARSDPVRIIAVDGVYSMSGTTPDLHALSALARRYDAWVYIDDAHGLGLLGADPSPERPWGRGGGGVVQWAGLDYARDRLIYVSGMSKALSSIGAFIVCPDAKLRARLHAANTFVHSGPIPTASLATTLAGIAVNAREGDSLRDHIHALTRRLLGGARELGMATDNPVEFPIVTVRFGGLEATLRGCRRLSERGLLVTPAIYPVVPVDRGGARFSLTAANTHEQVDQALEALTEIAKELV